MIYLLQYYLATRQLSESAFSLVENHSLPENKNWQMNEEAVTDLMRKVLQADKIIHEQQLGLSWLPPSEHIFHAGGEGGGGGSGGRGGGGRVGRLGGRRGRL